MLDLLVIIFETLKCVGDVILRTDSTRYFVMSHYDDTMRSKCAQFIVIIFKMIK